jgi:hypothetical protein
VKVLPPTERPFPEVIGTQEDEAPNEAEPPERGPAAIEDPTTRLRDDQAPIRNVDRQAQELNLRDPLRIDKNTTKRRKQKRGSAEEDESDTQDVAHSRKMSGPDIEDLIQAADDREVPRAHLFQTIAGEPGDPSLIDPDAAKRVLVTVDRYVAHVAKMIDLFWEQTGSAPADNIAYATTFFLGLSDPNFGRIALHAFQNQTMACLLEPSEVLEFITDFMPGFAANTGFGPVDDRPWDILLPLHKLLVGRPASFPVRPGLVIRRVVLKDCAISPSAWFLTRINETSFDLTLHRAGQFEILLTAGSRDGHTTLDRLLIEAIDPSEGTCVVASVPDYPRNPEKVRNWPRATLLVPDPWSLLELEKALGSLSDRDSSEVAGSIAAGAISMAERTLLRLAVTSYAGPQDLNTRVEPAHLTLAELTLLKMAIFNQSDDSDLNQVKAQIESKPAGFLDSETAAVSSTSREETVKEAAYETVEPE